MIKVGRRGSLNAWITVEGVQGHVAYPHRAANPVPVLVCLLERLCGHQLDDGHPEFQPSNLEITALETPAGATNVIPASASARLNIRFNPAHTGISLVRWLAAEGEAVDKQFAGKVRLKTSISGEAFLTPPGPFTALVQDAVEAVVGRRPVLSTTGGTSDARFIRALCPVVELGLVGTTMHQANERVPTQELLALATIYRTLIERYFEAFA
jgi:succinyl-diaminopimelate desuccinylase